MSILVDQHTRLVVQGLTGREGGFHAGQMAAYGTKIVAGVTPGRGGELGLDGTVPVFDTVREAVEKTGANTAASLSLQRAPQTPSPKRPHLASRPSSASPKGSPSTTWSVPSPWCSSTARD